MRFVQQEPESAPGNPFEDSYLPSHFPVRTTFQDTGSDCVLVWRVGEGSHGRPSPLTPSACVLVTMYREIPHQAH